MDVVELTASSLAGGGSSGMVHDIPPVASAAGREARFGGPLLYRRSGYHVAGLVMGPIASLIRGGSWLAASMPLRICLKNVGWQLSSARLGRR